MAGLVQNDVSHAGVAARWPQGGKSGLAVQVLHPALLAEGYRQPLILSVSSTATAALLAALLDHERVLTACEAAAAAKGNPRTFEFWEVALVLTAGAKVSRGRQQSSMISPIISGHPAQPGVAYLRDLLASKSVGQVMFEQHDDIVTWAAGWAQPQWSAPAAPATAPARPAQRPAAAPAPAAARPAAQPAPTPARPAPAAAARPQPQPAPAPARPQPQPSTAPLRAGPPPFGARGLARPAAAAPAAPAPSPQRPAATPQRPIAALPRPARPAPPPIQDEAAFWGD